MNCLEFRQRKLTDPNDSDEAIIAHREECWNCRRFENELKQMDEGLMEAFAVPVPERLESRVMLKQSFQRRPHLRPGHWAGIAASILAVAVLIATVGRPTPATALEHELASHLGKEEMMVARKTELASTAEIERAIRGAGIDVDVSLDQIIYAHPCVIDGKMVAHLIIREADQNVTVLLTPFDIKHPSSFNDSGWDGVIEPTSYGSIAVLAPEQIPARRFQEIMGRLRAPAIATGD